MIAILLFTAVIIFLLYDWINVRPPNFPPGPPHLPLVGCIPFLSRENFHLVVYKLKEKYGPVIGLVLGRRAIVAVTGPQEVLEVLKRDEFQNRPDGEFFRERTFYKRLGVMFNDGPGWVEQRRFTLRHLRDFGFGKSSMESIMVEEMNELIEEIQGRTVQASGLFNLSAVNVLWAVVAGKRFHHSDKELKRMMDAWTFIFRSGQPAGISLLTVLPILKKIAPVWTGYQKNVDVRTGLQNFIRNIITDHEKTFDAQNLRDFIDVYIQELRQQKSENTSFSDLQLISIIFDLFGAGAESSGNTLSFLLLYLALNPEKQRKAQRELDEVIGKERPPSLNDRTRLPYVESVLTEVIRINSIAPLTVPHCTAKATQLKGYDIPNKTFVLVSLHSLLHDKEHWGDPEVFRPERFLDSEGNFHRDEWFIPFGAGKRLCLGESLARNIIFLFATCLLQKVSFSIPEDDPTPTTIPLSGFTVAPRPFRVCMKSRD